jgi:hypothetical protein
LGVNDYRAKDIRKISVFGNHADYENSAVLKPSDLLVSVGARF